MPERAAILARDGTPLAEGPPAARSSPLGVSALNVAGEIGAPKKVASRELTGLGFPDGSLAGISGLEQAFNTRLAGQPGGELLAVTGKDDDGRVLARGEPVEGEPINTTIDPGLQQAAATALGGLFGGVAVLDTDDGAVRALAGIAYSAPQPPGSTFKIITTTAALEEDAVALDDTFPVETSNTTIGREISNAHDSPCGGTFVESFAESCNTVFAPLGVEVGGEKLVETAESFGFNSPAAADEPGGLAAINPAESTIPADLDSDVAVGRVGDRAGRGPRHAAADGVGVADDRRGRHAQPDAAGDRPRARPRRRARRGDQRGDRGHGDRPHARGRAQRHRDRGRRARDRGRRARPAPRSSGPTRPPRATLPPPRARSPSRSSTPGSRPSRPRARRSSRSG